MTAASARFRALVGSPATELSALMRRGETPEVDVLAGAEFRGANTAGWTARLQMQQFVRGFSGSRTCAWSATAGGSRRTAHGPRRRRPSRTSRFVRSILRPVTTTTCRRCCSIWGPGGGPRLDPARSIRDYRGRVEAGSDTLLLGRAFLALGPVRFSPTYFVLERLT